MTDILNRAEGKFRSRPVKLLFFFLLLPFLYATYQTYQAWSSITAPEKKQHSVAIACINPRLNECDLITKAVRSSEAFYIPNHAVRESDPKRSCYNNPNQMQCLPPSFRPLEYRTQEPLLEETPEDIEDNLFTYLPDNLLEGHRASQTQPDFWIIYDRKMGLNSSQTTTLSRTAHPLLPGDIISQITGGFTFDALTNPLDSRDAEIIVDRLVSGLNSKHYATIHRAVCASFPEHDNKRKTYNYSEWPLKHPSGCGGLHAPKRDGGPGAPKRSFENNQFCLTWGTPEEEIYVKACKYKYAWLFSWTVSIEKFRWTEQEPKLDTSMARQMVNQEDYRFSLQKKEAYLEAIGVGSLYNNSNHGRFISSATFKDLSEWKQTEEGWTSSAEYVHSDSGHIGFARFLIEKDGELCMHYNLDPDEDITDRPCDWRKDF